MIEQKRYKDYVQQPIKPERLAPLNARPKSTRGDFTGDRFKAETIRQHGKVDKDHIPRWNGLINVSALKKIKKGN